MKRDLYSIGGDLASTSAISTTRRLPSSVEDRQHSRCGAICLPSRTSSSRPATQDPGLHARARMASALDHSTQDTAPVALIAPDAYVDEMRALFPAVKVCIPLDSLHIWGV